MFQTDPFSGKKVACSSNRSKRPHLPKLCPFCPGSEHVTPPATLELPVLSNSKGNGAVRWLRACRKPVSRWSVRAFENAFPIVWGKNGRHEVIVETNQHGVLWEDFSEKQLALVFQAYQHRFRALSLLKNGKTVLLFKNFGDKSGASIAHEHAQIVSLAFVPDALEHELENKDVLDEWAEKEKSVCENGFFKAFCPAVSKYPFEVWVVAKDQRPGLGDFSAEQGLSLLLLMQSVIRKIKKVQGGPDYTVVFHAAPPGKKIRFHVEIIPRKAVWGGFELGSGVLVNFKEPHRAREELEKA